MKPKDYNGQIILQAAEEEFVNRGFSATNIFVIAKKTGITVPALHNYFENKEDMLQLIILKKIRIIAVSVLALYNKFPVEVALRKIIEEYFDVLAENPRTANFIYDNLIANNRRRRRILKATSTLMQELFQKIDSLIAVEVAKGKIRSVKASELMLNIISLNAFTFILLPAIQDLMPETSESEMAAYLAERKEANVQSILSNIIIK